MKSWWIALVTFERRGAEQDVLPEWAQGACGWMACKTTDEDSVRALLARDLHDCGLRLLEIDKLRAVVDGDDVVDIDGHLADNMQQLEAGKATAWGTIHCYKADGEA